MKNSLWLLVYVLIWSCSDKDIPSDKSILVSKGALSAGVTEIDQFIRDRLTDPYNMDVKYLFDQNELESNKYLIPPRTDVVLPYLRALIKIWVKPYERRGGTEFIKKYAIKRFVLVGGKNLNPSTGTKILGQAEGGKKVVIYELDDFPKAIKNKDRSALKQYFHTLHHEFGHILNQNKDFDRESFIAVTPGDFTGAWFNRTPKQALDLGFITPYSAFNEDENFVEIMATLFTNSAEEYQGILDQASEEGRKKLEKKTTMVKSYLKNKWNIDADRLQADIQSAMDELFKSSKSI